MSSPSFSVSVPVRRCAASSLVLAVAPCPQIVFVCGLIKVPICLNVTLIRAPSKASSAGSFSEIILLSARIACSQCWFVSGPRTKRELCVKWMRCEGLKVSPVACSPASVTLDFFVRRIMVRLAPRLKLTIVEPRTISKDLSECSEILSSLLRYHWIKAWFSGCFTIDCAASRSLSMTESNGRSAGDSSAGCL